MNRLLFLHCFTFLSLSLHLSKKNQKKKKQKTKREISIQSLCASNYAAILGRTPNEFHSSLFSQEIDYAASSVGTAVCIPDHTNAFSSPFVQQTDGTHCAAYLPAPSPAQIQMFPLLHLIGTRILVSLYPFLFLLLSLFTPFHSYNIPPSHLRFPNLIHPQTQPKLAQALHSSSPRSLQALRHLDFTSFNRLKPNPSNLHFDRVFFTSLLFYLFCLSNLAYNCLDWCQQLCFWVLNHQSRPRTRHQDFLVNFQGLTTQVLIQQN